MPASNRLPSFTLIFILFSFGHFNGYTYAVKGVSCYQCCLAFYKSMHDKIYLFYCSGYSPLTAATISLTGSILSTGIAFATL